MEHLIAEFIESVVSIDNRIMEFVIELRTPILTKMLTSVTGLGSSMAACVLLGLFHLAGWREEVVSTAVALALTGLVVGTLMFTIERPFPPQPVCMTGDSETVTSSFPSGHAASVTVFAMTARRSERLPFATVAALATAISFSRFYLGTHYPSDTVVGVLIGVGTFLVGVRIVKRLESRELVRQYLAGSAEDERQK